MAINTNRNDSTSNKQQASVLGLAPLASNGSVLGMSPISPPDIPASRAISRREDKLLAEFHEDLLIMEAAERKGEYGEYLMGIAQERASELYYDTVTYLLDTKNQARGTEAEPYMTEFAQRQIHQYSRQMLGALEIMGFFAYPPKTVHLASAIAFPLLLPRPPLQ